MILERLLIRVWRALRTPPPRGVPSPRVLPAYAALGRAVRDTVEIEPRLRLLVRQLAAELSGCRWCVEQGRHAWRQAFLPTPDLGALRHFATTPLFSERERAALAFTAALSRYAEATGGMPDAVLTELRRHFSEPEVVALTRLIALEHFYNPATGALGADARSTAAAGRSAAWPVGGPERRAAGSAMRNLW
jgi:alkylhydroperoxidase family enzyme